MALKTLKEQAQTDLDIQYSTDLPWVDTITYKGEPIPAQVRYERRPESRTGVLVRVAVIEVQVSDVPAPKRRDPVTIGSESWIVDLVEQGTYNLEWEITLISERRPII